MLTLGASGSHFMWRTDAVLSEFPCGISVESTVRQQGKIWWDCHRGYDWLNVQDGCLHVAQHELSLVGLDREKELGNLR